MSEQAPLLHGGHANRLAEAAYTEWQRHHSRCPRCVDCDWYSPDLDACCKRGWFLWSRWNTSSMTHSGTPGKHGEDDGT